jgi:myo-inositol-1(or 4)-monophosphatase
MTLLKIIRNASNAAKKTVLENLDTASEYTGDNNPYGDKTLWLDKEAEIQAINVLRESTISFGILTEEQGLIMPEEQPEYLVIMDPIDGSVNLERGIPLCSIGLSAIPYDEPMDTDDVEISIIDSIFTKETYIAKKGKGARKNGKTIRPSQQRDTSTAIISYDTNRPLVGSFGEASLRVMSSVRDIRRTASNLLDLCWTADGSLDAMIDLRGVLPIVHVSGTHIVSEAGGFVLEEKGTRFNLPIEPSKRMSFIAAGTEELARQFLSLFKG